jgi:hypothetical protein
MKQFRRTDLLMDETTIDTVKKARTITMFLAALFLPQWSVAEET